MPRLHKSLAPIAIALLAGLAMASGAASSAELLSTHEAWKAYRHGQGEELMCFAVAEASEPGDIDGERDKPYIYVTAWPKAGIKAEISVLAGFDLRKGTEIKVDISGSRFNLFADGDRAYVGDPNEELRLLEAMRRGLTMTVEATSNSGETARDTYSLLGVTAAVQAVASNCS